MIHSSLWEALQARFEWVKPAPDDEFFLELRNFIEFLDSSPYLQAIAIGLVFGKKKDEERFSEHEKQTIQKLAPIRQTIAAQLSTLAQCSARTSQLQTEYDEILAGKKRSKSLSASEYDAWTVPKGLIETLGDMVSLCEQYKLPVDDQRNELKKLGSEYLDEFRKYVDSARISVWRSLAELIRAVSLIDRRISWKDFDLELAFEIPWMRSVLEKKRPLEDKIRQEYLRHLERVLHYLAERIDRHSLALYVLKRFKNRCEWYDRREIYGLCVKKGRREYQLQLKLARFLFDQGFTPIFSSRLGTSEPDLTDLRHQQPLVLEAKILHERGKGDILKGFNQIYRYIATIGEDEGYYVIFNPQKFVLDILDNVVFNAKSIRIIQVHVNPAPPSRTKLRALTVCEEELISAVK